MKMEESVSLLFSKRSLFFLPFLNNLRSFGETIHAMKMQGMEFSIVLEERSGVKI